MYNLTDAQKELLKWLVAETKAGSLRDEFLLTWVKDGTLSAHIAGYTGSNTVPTTITRSSVEILMQEKMIHHIPRDKGSDIYSLTGLAFEAVGSNFSTPDTSFIKFLSPLEDITNLDAEIKARCLPILGAGISDPKSWDSAIRTAATILEERLRDVGKIADPNRVGRDLVNDIFNKTGTLNGKFAVPGERDGYRELYAGMIGAVRNPYGHRHIDPTPERGGATLMFINLLLQLLEDLR